MSSSSNPVVLGTTISDDGDDLRPWTGLAPLEVDNGGSGSGESRKSVFKDTWRLLRDPNYAKMFFASGLLLSVSVVSPVNTLVIVGLKTEVWGSRMSEYSAYGSAGMNIVAILLSGPFGRLSDRMDRRVALILVGILCFLPTWMLLPLLMTGYRSAALYVYTVLYVVSGIACLSITGCPTLFALADDLVLPEDRDIAFGAAFASNVLLVLLSNVFGLFVVAGLGKGEISVIIYAVVLSVSYFLSVGSVRLPIKTSLHLPESNGKSDEGGIGLSMLAPLRLACGYAPLRNICLVYAFVSIPETASFDVNTQYVLSALGLMKSSDEGHPEKVRIVSALINYPGQFALFPAFFVIGLVAKRVGALKLVKSLVVPLAVLQLLPFLFQFAPSMLAASVEGLCLILTFIIFVPLQTLCAEVAPPGRVGEAMGAVGASKQLSALLGNMVAALLSPILLRTSLHSPLSLMFPLCSILCLAAFPFARRIQLPSSCESSPPSDAKSLRNVSQD